MNEHLVFMSALGCHIYRVSKKHEYNDTVAYIKLLRVKPAALSISDRKHSLTALYKINSHVLRTSGHGIRYRHHVTS